MIQSVSRAIDLMQAVGEHPQGAGVSELARACKLKVQTAQTLLKTLAARGMLRFDADTRRYTLGLALSILAAQMDRVDMLADLVAPFLERFYAQTGETVAAVALQNKEVVLLGTRGVQSPFTSQPRHRVMRYPAEMASGRILLSRLSESEIEAMAKRHIEHGHGPEKGLTAKRLMASIRKAGETGEIIIGNKAAGLYALAVRVVDPTSRVNLSLACNIPHARYTKSLGEKTVRQLKASAAEINQALAALTGTVA